jgi:hypothetical protein
VSPGTRSVHAPGTTEENASRVFTRFGNPATTGLAKLFKSTKVACQQSEPVLKV